MKIPVLILFRFGVLLGTTLAQENGLELIDEFGRLKRRGKAASNSSSTI